MCEKFWCQICGYKFERPSEALAHAIGRHHSGWMFRQPMKLLKDIHAAAPGVLAALAIADSASIGYGDLCSREEQLMLEDPSRLERVAFLWFAVESCRGDGCSASVAA